MRYAFAIIALFMLTGCGSNRAEVISNGQIRLVYDDQPGIAARWDLDNMAIRFSAMSNNWTLAHELCHAADDLGANYDKMVSMVGDVPPAFAAQLQAARAVAIEARKIGGYRCYWLALYKLHGPGSIHHHDIMASLKPYMAKL